jgi:hypothetical protein
MPAVLPNIKRWPQPEGTFSGLGRRRGRWVMSGDVRRATAFVDIDRTPRPVVNRDEYAVSFDNLPDGRVVVCSMLTNPPGRYAIRIHSADWPTDPTAGPTEVYPMPGGLTLAEVWSVSGRVVAFGSLIKQSDPPGTHRAYLLDRGKFVPAPGLPAVSSFSRDYFGHQRNSNGKATLATGENVLIWEGEGYEWTGKQFELRWELGAKDWSSEGWTSVPWGEDGFFYLSNAKVMYARRGQKPVRVLPDADRVMCLSPGPDDSVILCLHRDPKRHVARVWFPAEGTYIPLFRAHIGSRPSWPAGPMYWSAKARRTHFLALAAIPDSDLLALKRVQARGKGYQVPKA